MHDVSVNQQQCFMLLPFVSVLPAVEARELANSFSTDGCLLTCAPTSQGRALMSPYLPRNGSSGSPFSEGGALFALGLIHANHGQDMRSFLSESLSNTGNEVRRLQPSALISLTSN